MGLGQSRRHRHHSHHVGSSPVQEEATGIHTQGYQVPTGGLLRSVQEDKGSWSESYDRLGFCQGPNRKLLQPKGAPGDEVWHGIQAQPPALHPVSPLP